MVDVDRITGCLLGGGIGDALGAPVEGQSLATIRGRLGPDGLTDYVDERYGLGAITDDTQLTLYTLEALVQASARARANGIGGARIGGATGGLLQQAYLRWLRAQGEQFPEQPIGVSSELFDVPALSTRRGPGKTTLGALHAAAARRQSGLPLGTVENPVNDGKTCGGVMRAAPAGFPSGEPAVAFALGAEAAALTHGHPSGYLPAGVMAATVCRLVRGDTLPAALALARSELERRPGHDETSAALDAAARLAGAAAPEGAVRQSATAQLSGVAGADAGWPSAEAFETLGAGWTGEEALAMGVCAALLADGAASEADVGSRGVVTAVRRGLLLAVNHGGDSDSTGGLCGALLGARYGTAGLPGRWVAGLEVRDQIVLLASDAALEFGIDPPAGTRAGRPLNGRRLGVVGLS